MHLQEERLILAMIKKTSIPMFAALAGFFLLTGLCMAFGTLYTYKCPKCGLIQQYSTSTPGAKCPNDGWTMTPQY